MHHQRTMDQSPPVTFKQEGGGDYQRQTASLHSIPTSHQHPSPLSALDLSDTGITLGLADQSCNECRRRKSKCNKAIPTCNLCMKYRRHCLYEKHSRTPLTRKHLTEVEERLERAEALVRQLRTFLPPHLRQKPGASDPAASAVQPSYEHGSASEAPAPYASNQNSAAASSSSYTHHRSPEEGAYSAHRSSDSSRSTPAKWQPSSRRQDEVSDGERDQRKISSNVLESAPTTEDFEWDEQDTATQPSLSPEAIHDGELESPILDGMASLTVGENDAGYLGIASGAALLRIFEPSSSRRPSQMRMRPRFQSPTMLVEQPDPNKHIVDSMIDAYFSLYHLSYPIIHESTFRAQYSEVIPRPSGESWLVLAYTVATLGVFTTATTITNLDLELFSHARSIMSFNLLETGNLTLVQALTLISNYQQKRDKPNSGYNYLGLAVRMAMGLGLHKEFQGWNISPLNMEIRRRVWWSLCVFDVGATITFSRPQVYPFEGVEVSLPLNVNERDLTAASKCYPPETNNITPYSAVRAQASFHVATDIIYTRVISKPLPTAEELLQLDRDYLQKWVDGVPDYYSQTATVPAKYAFGHCVMQWRYRNFRIIMYRPFVIRRALFMRDGRRDDSSPECLQAYETCLADAKFTINSTHDYWANNEQNRLGAWYALYFLFQSALIPCICLRNAPFSTEAADWRDQVLMTLRTITAMAYINPSARRSYQIIMELCGRYLNLAPASPAMEMGHPSVGSSVPESHSIDVTEAARDAVKLESMTGFEHAGHGHHDDMVPIDESPQTQINSVVTMMWPNVAPMEAADLVMGDNAWLQFLQGGDIGGVTPEWMQ